MSASRTIVTASFVAEAKEESNLPCSREIFDFVDATLTGRLRADAAARISSLVTSGSSFLDVWNRYGQIENEASLRRARNAGTIEYDHVESLPDGRYRFSLAEECTLDSAERFRQALSEEQGLGIEA